MTKILGYGNTNVCFCVHVCSIAGCAYIHVCLYCIGVQTQRQDRLLPWQPRL